MKIIITESFDESCRRASEIILRLVADKPDCTLGLATGSTAAAVYPFLVSAYADGCADFSRVKTVNLDEYLGLPAGDKNSYRASMENWLFGKTDFNPSNTYVADGTADPICEMKVFRKKLESGVDLQLLGVGANGHIGFNEPGDNLIDGVHVETLSPQTRMANSRFFSRPEDVPAQAITMGMGDILRAKRLLLLITGERKRAAARILLRGEEVTTRWPVTFLKLHPAVTVVLDQALAAGLDAE